MNEFKENILPEFKDIIVNIIVGMGPNGQLKYTNER